MWNRDVLGCLNIKIKELGLAIADLDSQADVEAITKEEVPLLESFKSESWRTSMHLDSLQAQIARMKWKAEGDQNMKYFYILASIYF